MRGYALALPLTEHARAFRCRKLAWARFFHCMRHELDSSADEGPYTHDPYCIRYTEQTPWEKAGLRVGSPRRFGPSRLLACHFSPHGLGIIFGTGPSARGV